MIATAFQYHGLTAYDRQRMSAHQLDWDNQPQFFKSYPGSRIFPLLRPETLPSCSLRELFEPWSASGASVPVCDLELVSRLLLLTSVITAHSRFDAGEIFYRSHPAAGALYPIEIYLYGPGFDDLPAGMFHYDVRRPALEQLGRGSFPAVSGGTASPTLVLSAVFRRSTWKYRDRAYRYVLLDCGHLLGNLRLALRALGYDFELVADFSDAAVNRELGFDPDEEAALFLVRIVEENFGKGRPSGDACEKIADDVSCTLETVADESRYPLLEAVQRLTSQSLTPGATSRGRESDKEPFAVENWFPLPGIEARFSGAGDYV
ncbi:MAG: SagB/ThcOx family dehydrogenase, partial [Deltaproteobacteria bacterium]|nr:SagB/ThcOx family dehydrogenase [Deltaproteobacteria bacterium]